MLTFNQPICFDRVVVYQTAFPSNPNGFYVIERDLDFVYSVRYVDIIVSEGASERYTLLVCDTYSECLEFIRKDYIPMEVTNEIF